MSFELNKKNALSKIDKSKKGSIDARIKDIIDLINSLDDYYTTSSCSGRILVLEPADKKNKVKWLFVTHDTVSLEEVKKALEHAVDAWLKKESAIFHIACKTRDAADKLLNLVRSAGFKRAGIISPKKNLIEVIGTDQLAVPLTKNKKLLVDDTYLSYVLDIANSMQLKNFKRLEILKNYIKHIKK